MAQVSTRVRLAVLAAVLGFSAGGLAACSDDPPSGSPPPSSTSSSPTSPSPSGPPTLPAEAKGRSPEAAEAFVRYYVDLINYAIETLDTDPLKASSAATCAVCSGFVKAAASMRDSDRHYEGGAWEVTRVQPLPARKGHQLLRIFLDVSAQKVVSSGDVVRRNPASKTAVTVDLIVVASQWRVASLQGVTGS